MAYRVERSLVPDQDLAAIFDFLLESYMAFDDGRSEALERAAERVKAIEAEMLSLGYLPHQGKRGWSLPDATYS